MKVQSQRLAVLLRLTPAVVACLAAANPRPPQVNAPTPDSQVERIRRIETGFAPLTLTKDAPPLPLD